MPLGNIRARSPPGSSSASIPPATRPFSLGADRRSAEHWRLEVDANRRLRFSCGAGYAVASRVVGDLQWHHIAVALDPLVSGRPHISDIRLYVDARPQAVYEMNEQELAADGMEEPQNRRPLSDSATSQPFNGIIDDVQIFDTALSPANVRQVYNAAIP